MSKIESRLCDLRRLMSENAIDAFITPSTDPHCGEYVPERWKSRRWISGFTGSAGIAVVTAEKAALWTDSRYFIQAKEQLEGTGFQLMKEKIEGTPSIVEWLGSFLKPGDTVAVDGWVNTVAEVNSMREELDSYGRLVTDIDPYDKIWLDRPGIPDSKVFVQKLEYAGESAAHKLTRIREQLGGHALLTTFLEDIAWTLNLRADDILYTPFFVSYLIITPKNATLYINKEKVPQEVEKYLCAEGVDIRPYETILDDLKACDIPIEVQLDKTIQCWQWYGSTMITLIAAVIGINPEIFEAAEIDGAGRWRKFWNITLPSVRPIMLFTLVTSMIGGLSMFDIPMLFGEGKQKLGLQTIAIYIYQTALKDPYMYNRAAAASIILFLIIMVISVFLFWLLRDKDAAKLAKMKKQEMKRAKALGRGL